MSKHWNPDRTRWLSASEFRALSPKQRRALFAGRAQSKREMRARARSWPAGATAGLVLLAAACVGTVVGLYQAAGPYQPVAREAQIEWKEAQAVPRAEADRADARWQGRAQSEDGPSTSSGRTAAVVRTSLRPSSGQAFGYCFSGGGSNCVVDGDTFWIGGEKVRIAGIDAPETHPSRCAYEARLGNAATEKLRALLNSGAVTMTSIDRDRDVYGRLLRDVQVNGQDVGAAMVSAGVAREYAGGRRPWC